MAFKWTPVHEGMPPDQSAVVVIMPSGDEQPMWYERGLWFFADRSMYTYSIPAYWRLSSKTP